MSNLLPPNANSHEQALDDTTIRLGAVPVDIYKLWNPVTCPIAQLPWLAWSLSIDEWDETWTEAQKRNVVQASYDAHAHKGTPFGIIRSLNAIGYDNVQIREGEVIFYNGAETFDGSWHYGSDGYWPQFNVILNIGYMPSDLERQRIVERIERYKNARSQLKDLIFTNLFYDGTFDFDGANNFNAGVF